MTIVEFLLARIAEDEATLREGWEAWDGQPAVVGHTLRQIAECGAKRAVVELIAAEDEELRSTEVGDLDWIADRRDALGNMLGHLAQPYRDHPDFNELWNP